ncbi:molybdenum cofactor guanylyltransferase [Microbacterium sp.]|uniref:molybdenum cofactor guanylyltransferase n=1 Tax=Microbacterium sp. TaxID=51671 RepID=UPI003C70702F
MTLQAVLLAGGRASRMGGVDKPGLLVDGVSMRDRAIAAVVAASASPVLVVGPASDSVAAVRWVREDPPFAGPAAAVVTALAAIGSDAADWTLLLACDLPRPEGAVRLLADRIPSLAPESDGVCLADDDGRMQWLTGAYRTAALARAAAALPDGGRDQPVRALVAGLSVDVLADPEASARDVDTWEDYEELTKEHP